MNVFARLAQAVILAATTLPPPTPLASGTAPVNGIAMYYATTLSAPGARCG